MSDIWEEAKKIFKKKIQDVDSTSLAKSRKSLESAIDDLKREPSDTEESHGRFSKRSSDKKKASTIDSRTVIARMEVFLGFGDQVMVAAPETVSLVWMGLSTIGRIFIKDQTVRDIIEDATEKMSAAILVCEIYAQRYASGSAEDSFGKTRLSIRNQMPELFATILQFFYLATNHLERNSFGRILKSNFRKESHELKDISDDAQTKLEALQSMARIDFEETALSLLREMRSGLNELDGLKKLTKQAFASVNSRLRKVDEKLDSIESHNTAEEIESHFSKNLKWFEQGHIVSLRDPVDHYKENVSEENRLKKSCQWIFEDHDFNKWDSNKHSGILCLHGQGGVGKSFILFTIIKKFDKPTKTTGSSKDKRDVTTEDPLLLYFFCKLGDPHAANSTKIILHLCAQLFEKAGDNVINDEQTRLKLQKKCNTVVEQSKKTLADSERK